VNKSIRDKIESVLDDKFDNEQTKATILRMIPIAEVAAVDDEKLRENVEELLETDDGIKFVIAEMEAPTPSYVTRTTRKLGVSEMSASDSPLRSPAAKKIGGREKPRTHIVRSTKKL
jgi:hypothetical protein